MFLLRRKIRRIEPLHEVGYVDDDVWDPETKKWKRVRCSCTLEFFEQAKIHWEFKPSIWAEVVAFESDDSDVDVDSQPQPQRGYVAVTDSRVICGVANLHALRLEMENIYFELPLRSHLTRNAFREWLAHSQTTLTQFRDGNVTESMLRDIKTLWREAISILA